MPGATPGGFGQTPTSPGFSTPGFGGGGLLGQQQQQKPFGLQATPSTNFASPGGFKPMGFGQTPGIGGATTGTAGGGYGFGGQFGGIGAQGVPMAPADTRFSDLPDTTKQLIAHTFYQRYLHQQYSAQIK